MSGPTVTFAGSGDSFGSGGRFQACISVKAPNCHLLLDCGASSLIALRQAEIDPNDVDVIACSHLHGDHFAGVPFLIVDGHVISHRTKPLTIVGPPGTKHRLDLMTAMLFPGFTRTKPNFKLSVIELAPLAELELESISLTGFAVNHYDTDCGAPPLALRTRIGDRTIAYSGDTDWVDSLVPAAEGADLFICEAWFRTTKFRFHMDLDTLERHLPRIEARRVMLTHLGPEMLTAPLDARSAYDGLIVQIT